MNILTKIAKISHNYARISFDPTRFQKKDIEQSISARFEEQVRQHPYHLAVKSRTQQATYYELNARANQLAHALLLKYPGTTPVVLLFEQGINFLTALLAVLKTGRAYLPLDVSFPYERNAYILDDACIQLILTQRNHLTLAHQLAQDRYSLFEIEEVDSSFPIENPEHSISPETLAYLMYTSGSTGQPKGVMQNHRNVLHNCMIQTYGMQITSSDRITLFYSCSVMGAVRNIFNALLNGATLYPFNVKSTGFTHLAEWMIQEEITVYHSVASLFRHFANTLTGQEAFHKLRLVILGGEATLKQDAELYKKYFPPTCFLYTSLGSTETGTVRQFIVHHETPLESALVPLGYAVEDKDVFLLDNDDMEVSSGEVGEIVVKSQYLALGYWQKPALTQTLFTHDDITGQSTYRTGDMGRLLPDGCLLHMGRKDFQVKIRGYRVEISEIETLLIQIENVSEVVVVAHEMTSGEKRLVAYLVPKHLPAPTRSTLRQYLMGRLPDYMIPSTFVLLTALPLTPNGKIDRCALPKPKYIETEETFTAPHNEIELQLQHIWEDVLKVSPISVTESFFELGGHSLLAIRLLAEVKRVFNKDFPVLTLFQTPTIEQFAPLLSGWNNKMPFLRILIPIQSRGYHPPLFFVGSTNFGRLLSTQLGNDQPVYGLNIFGLRKINEIEVSLNAQDIAREFIREVQSVQAHGPYHLCGYCGDAKIAFEMAQQFLAQGEQIALLVFIDVLWQKKNRYQRFWKNLLKFGPTSYLVHLGQRTLKFRTSQLKLKFNTWKRRWYRSRQESFFPLEIQQFEFIREFLGTLRSYVPRPYSGKVTLFLSSEWYTEELSQFSQVIQGGIELYEVPGYHDNLFFSPQLEVLGEKVRYCLDKLADS